MLLTGRTPIRNARSWTHWVDSAQRIARCSSSSLSGTHFMHPFNLIYICYIFFIHVYTSCIHFYTCSYIFIYFCTHFPTFRIITYFNYRYCVVLIFIYNGSALRKICLKNLRSNLYHICLVY